MSIEDNSDNEIIRPASGFPSKAGLNSNAEESSRSNGDRVPGQAVPPPNRSATGTVSEKAGDDGWTRLQILEKIASGGMGTVYRAMHSTMERECAVKILSQKNDSDSSVKRFFKEARLVCSLDHKHIVKVYSFGFNHEKAPYFVMELLKGKSLDQVFKRDGRLKLHDFMPVFLQVLDAIDYAHHRQIIHRDLKPANIFLADCHEPGAYNVKLMDFGIAQIVDADSDIKLTKTGALLGTPLYMSPEQTKNQPIDQRSDIYSIGAIMYEAFVGVPPFSGETALDVMYKHANQAIDEKSMPTASSLRNLRKCIMKCLEKNPADRFQSAADLRDELKIACDGIDDRDLLQKSNIKYSPKIIIAVSAAILVFLIIMFFAAARHNNGDSKKQANSLVDKPQDSPNKSSNKCEDDWKNNFNRYEKKRQEGNQKEAERYRKEAIYACERAIAEARRELQRKMAKDQLRDIINRPYNGNMELVKLYVGSNNFDQADASFNAALEDCKFNHNLICQALQYYIPILAGFGRDDEAISILQNRIKADKALKNPSVQTVVENSTHLLLLAQLYMHMGRSGEAISLLQASKTMNKSSFDREALVLVLLAKCSRNDKHKINLAEQACERIIENGADDKFFDDAVSALDLCAVMIETDQPKKAKFFYKNARQLGKHVRDPQLLANAMRDSCGFELEKKDFDAVEQIISGQDLAQITVKGLLENNVKKDIDGSPVECEQLFAAAVSSFLQGGNINDVISNLEKCLTLSVPGSDANARINWMLGRCYHKNGSDDKALACFSEAIKYPKEFISSRHFLSEGIAECAPLLRSHSREKEALELESLTRK